MSLGREKYTVHRHSNGRYNDDGLWVEAQVEKVTICANIQGALFWNSVRFSDSGDIGKQAISIRSDQALYISNDKNKGDQIEFEGALWEVRDARLYKNLKFTSHWEAVAVLMDSSKLPRS